VRLRKKLDETHARYKIRIFEGEHGWAPPEVWLEALNWMDLQAMATGALPRDNSRIQQSLNERMTLAAQMKASGLLEAAREYQSIVRDFNSLADVSQAQEQLAALLKDKAYKNEQKAEADAVSQQTQITEDASARINAIGNGGLEAGAYAQVLNT